LKKIKNTYKFIKLVFEEGKRLEKRQREAREKPANLMKIFSSTTVNLKRN